MVKKIKKKKQRKEKKKRIWVIKGRRFYKQIQDYVGLTQTSPDSFNCMYNKKALMLNIYYSLKTMNSLKIKKVVLKHSVPIGIPWKEAQTWSVHYV